jgi:hypothetical protein
MRIGIDLGGTKIEIIALDEVGATLTRRRVATPAGDYDGTVRAIAGLVDGVESELGRHGTVGVATPGTISTRTGLMKNSNSTVLNGRSLDRDIAAALARPIRMENDANCLALSEAVDGAAAGAAVVFGVILGTGVGGGLVVERRVVAGRNRIAGEWGHNPLPWPRVRPAIAANPVASRPFSPAPGSRAAIAPSRASRRARKRSRASPARAGRPHAPVSASIATVWRARSPLWSTSSTPT